jgi:very-short-patch-repair endonuclease
VNFADRSRGGPDPSAKRTPVVRFAERGEPGRQSVGETHAIRVAARQAGVISTRQLAAAGVPRRTVAKRVEAGVMRRVHRGVYLYGAVAGPWAAEWAAFLACGPGVRLSHSTAIALCGLGDRPELVHVTTAADGRPHRGVLRHRATIPPEDEAQRHGLPITAPARTLLDVASSMPAVELQRLIEEAQVQRLVTRRQLEDALDRGAGRAGAPNLRAVLARDDEPAFTRSEGEERLRALLRAARLPMPRTNVRIGRWEVDALWQEQRLVVEIDGYKFHRTRAAFERDRRKDAELLTLGYRVIRITWRQLVDEPHAVVATLAAALSAARCA